MNEAHRKRERQKARDLRQTTWWRQKLGDGQCHYCGERFERQELTMDHKIPIARGGKTTKKNVVVSCKYCNFNKSYKSRAELILETL